jgi:hypothetical protein
MPAGQRNRVALTENAIMDAVSAGSLLLADLISSLQSFVSVFTGVYVLLIFAYILTSWVRLPYSPTLNRIQRFLYDVVRYRELEALLRQTLVSAERTAAELRDGAQKQAELVVEEAHAAAREIVRAARAERERLAADAARIRAQLAGALDALDEGDANAEAA